MRLVAIACAAIALLVAAVLLLGPPEPEAADRLEEGGPPEAAPTLKTKGAIPEAPSAEQAPVDARALYTGFASEDPEARQAAYQAAARARRIPFDAKLIRLMVDWFQTDDHTLIHRAMVVLLRTGPAVRPLVEPLLEHEDGRVRRDVLVLYGSWARFGFDEQPLPNMLRFLKDEDDRVRRYAMDVVARGVPYDAEIAAWLREQIVPTPGAAYFGPEVALARMGPKGVAQLVAMLDDPKLRTNALGGLSGAPPQAIRQILPTLAELIRDDRDEDTQVGAVRLLFKLEGDIGFMLPVLNETLHGESLAVRVETLMALEQAGARAAPALEGLLLALSDNDERIASRAAGILGTLEAHHARILPALRTAIDGEAGDHAAAALGALGAAGVPYLQDALDSGDEDARYFALSGVAALGKTGAPLLSRVTALLAEEDYELQRRAATALGRMGEVAAPAMPALLRLVHDETLTPGGAAGIFMRMGSPAERALLDELKRADAAGQARVLHVIAAFEGRSAFALDALAPFLEDKDNERRQLAVWGVLAALERPADATEANAITDPALRSRVRSLIEGLEDDPVPSIGRRVRGALAWIAELDAGRR
ncbi:MAG: hypothetical protein QNJ90_13715 [Planctomycetota bacterium]|nr:hypothetical protein [Planctomycetota bacterium]